MTKNVLADVAEDAAAAAVDADVVVSLPIRLPKKMIRRPTKVT
jgi:hypothetical protein